MSSMMLAHAGELAQMQVEFPNLFGGTEITYRRGFEIFGVPVYWYGVLIAVGVILAYIYAMYRATRDFGLVKDRVFDVVFVCIVGGFLFARIYYCVFVTLDPNNPTNYDFVTTFTTIRDGGIAMYGGTIGAVLIGLLMCKLRKVNFFAMVDLASLGFLIGQTIGRWGNFINQEAYGAECDTNWLFAMTGSVINEEMHGAYVHPCFLYESVWCLIGFIFLHIYSKKLRTFDGEVALLYLAWYGFGRMFIEQLRTDSLYAGSIKVSQLVAVVSFALSMICFVVMKVRTHKTKKPLYVNSGESQELIESDLKAELEYKEKKKNKKDKLADTDADSDKDSDKKESEEAAEEKAAEENAEEKSAEETTEEKAAEEKPSEAKDDKEKQDPEKQDQEKTDQEKSDQEKTDKEKSDGGEDN